MINVILPLNIGVASIGKFINFLIKSGMGKIKALAREGLHLVLFPVTYFFPSVDRLIKKYFGGSLYKLWSDYEAGKIDSKVFKEGIRQLYPEARKSLSDKQIEAAWKSMIMLTPEARKLLNEVERILKQNNTKQDKVFIYLPMTTNPMHLEEIQHQYGKLPGIPYCSFAKQAKYKHLTEMIKQDIALANPEIKEHAFIFWRKSLDLNSCECDVDWVSALGPHRYHPKSSLEQQNANMVFTPAKKIQVLSATAAKNDNHETQVKGRTFRVK